MTVTIGPYTFPVVHYDEDGDVLYLKTHAPDNAVEFYDTPEGHGVRLGANGGVVGITLLNPRWLLEHDGKVEITLPQHVELGADLLRKALVAAI